jgi:diguanylate cyclase (GGDEF)-like protein
MQAPDMRSTLSLVGPAVHELLAADGAVLLLILGGEEYGTEFDSRGLMKPVSDTTTLYRCARRAMVDNTPILLPDMATEPGIQAGALGATGGGSILAVPFPPIKPVCVLAAFWRLTMLHDQLAKQISTLRSISEIMGAAIGNIDFRQDLEGQLLERTNEIAKTKREHATELKRRDRLEEEIHRLSVTDVMTGLLNRRGFFLHAEQSFKVARRQRLPSALIYADIDGLKAVNDGLGHDVGDQLIQNGARILRESFRDSDVIARLGGDEFAAFTLDTAQPGVIQARIQENLKKFSQSAALPYPFSFSIGIVKCDPTSDLTLSDYLSLADKQMYSHKKRQSE